MPIRSRRLQFHVREAMPPARGPGAELLAGFVSEGDVVELEWASRRGAVYLDGSHFTRPLHMGDIVRVSTDAPRLRLFGPRKREA